MNTSVAELNSVSISRCRVHVGGDDRGWNQSYFLIWVSYVKAELSFPDDNSVYKG